MLRVVDKHTDFIGQIAKVTEFGAELEKEYEEVFGIGNYHVAKRTHGYCYMGGRYEMSLMFIDEPPFSRDGVTWYCLKEVGVGVTGDWHWYTLNQLMICTER